MSDKKENPRITFNDVEYRDADLDAGQLEIARKLGAVDLLLKSDISCDSLQKSHDLFVILSDYRNVHVQAFQNTLQEAEGNEDDGTTNNN